MPQDGYKSNSVPQTKPGPWKWGMKRIRGPKYLIPWKKATPITRGLGNRAKHLLNLFSEAIWINPNYTQPHWPELSYSSVLDWVRIVTPFSDKESISWEYNDLPKVTQRMNVRTRTTDRIPTYSMTANIDTFQWVSKCGSGSFWLTELDVSNIC